ncbi:MAG TPA: class I SAM-dependent methyltransferase [Blastocatellia bacterium]|nr:class I SAM-dependent methyltransferase [Blastocatellia bacterium]
MLEWGLNSPEVRRQRRCTLEPARGAVLEIGFGTGLNLPHYPESVTRLTVIDPQRMLPTRVERRISQAPMPVEMFFLDASGRLPFDDDSFDSVVTTFTLCSIDDLPAALAGIRRVLRPDGRFIFLEHGRSDDPKVARRQDFYNPVHRFLALGCNVNRPIDANIRAAGFEVVSLDRFLMPETPKVLGEMYRGAARKL